MYKLFKLTIVYSSGFSKTILNVDEKMKQTIMDWYMFDLPNNPDKQLFKFKDRQLELVVLKSAIDMIVLDEITDYTKVTVWELFEESKYQVRLCSLLNANAIEYVDELTSVTRIEISKIHGMGGKSYKDMIRIMGENSLEFKK